MGGIYNRLIVVANFTHFFIGELALIKIAAKGPGISTALLPVACIYTLIEVLFAVILYFNPVKANTPEQVLNLATNRK